MFSPESMSSYRGICSISKSFGSNGKLTYSEYIGRVAVSLSSPTRPIGEVSEKRLRAGDEYPVQD